LNFTWIILLSIPLVLYLVLSLLLRHGLHRSYAIHKNLQLSVSVIVAARNEAENILDCLHSLVNLDYPENLLEIIVVNDRSEDRTEHIITEFIKGKSHFKYFKISSVIQHLSGKASAIFQAIDESKGDIIFITDADCVVPEEWVRKMISYFLDRVGMVAGFTLLDHSKNLFKIFQNLDWGYMLSVAAGAVGIGIPLTCIGNNFAFRRSVYDEVGGYEGVGFSITEDFALLKAIAERTNWEIIFPVDEDCLVKSKPVKTLRHFFSQRRRWAIGGQSVHWFGKILIGTSLISHLVFIGLFMLSQKYFLFITFFLIILTGDYLLVKFPLNRLNSSQYLKYLPLYKIFFISYSVTLLLSLLFSKKVIWKGIKYRLTKRFKYS